MTMVESWALIGLLRALQAAHPISSDASLRTHTVPAQAVQHTELEHSSLLIEGHSHRVCRWRRTLEWFLSDPHCRQEKD